MKRWPTMPLGEVCFAKSGNSKIIKGTLSTENDGSLFPAYSATGQDVFSDGFDYNGDGVVISAVGARCGKCFIAKGKWRAIANTHVILPKPDKANVRFLWYLLNDESFWIKGGTAQPFVKVGDSLKKQIAVPPLVEQERIVELLDEADELRKIRIQADSRTAALIPALFHEMFGDPSANSKHWPVAMLGDVAPLKSGYAFKSTDYRQSGLKLVRISNLDGQNLVFDDGTVYLPESFLDEYPAVRLSAGDVLIAMSGATTGKLGMVRPSDVPSLLNQRVGKFFIRDTKQIEPTFLFSMLNLPAVARKLLGDAAGSAQPNASPSGVGRVNFPLPPITLQKQFAQRVTEIRELETAQAASRRRLEDLFQSLLHRAFNGEL